MFAAVFEQIAVSPLAMLAYATMTFLLVETIMVALRGEIWLWRARRTRPSRSLTTTSPKELRNWIEGGLRRTIWRTDLIVQLAPVMGLGWTMASFAAATFGMNEALSSDPQRVFNLLGLGAGTSVFGVVCLAIGQIQMNRLESVADCIAHMPPPTPRAPAPHRIRRMEANT